MFIYTNTYENLTVVLGTPHLDEKKISQYFKTLIINEVP